jgi:hypothetical protein
VQQESTQGPSGRLEELQIKLAEYGVEAAAYRRER